MIQDTKSIMQSSYGPYILNGSNGLGLGRMRWRKEAPHYSIWLAESGILYIERGKTREKVLAPCALFHAPGEETTLFAPAATPIRFLSFDVVYQKRERIHEANPAMWHVDRELMQPSPRELWEVDIPLILPANLYDACNVMMQSCCGMWWRDEMAYLRSNAKLGLWLADLLDTVRAKQPAKGKDWLDELKEKMGTMIETGISVQRMAELAGMSRQRFRAIFLERYKETPSQWLIQTRIGRAQQLMLMTQHDFKTIAKMCGVKSANTFALQFKKLVGQSPGQWRREQKVQRV